jgi:hypothetical protein
MPKYIVYLTTGASTSVEVEADNPEQAEERAYAANLPTVCAQCAGMGSDDPGLDLSDAWEVSSVTDENGKEIKD